MLYPIFASKPDFHSEAASTQSKYSYGPKAFLYYGFYIGHKKITRSVLNPYHII